MTTTYLFCCCPQPTTTTAYSPQPDPTCAVHGVQAIIATLRANLDAAERAWDLAVKDRMRAEAKLARAARLRVDGNKSWRDEAGMDRALARLTKVSR